jgi:hypothetical protein
MIKKYIAPIIQSEREKQKFKDELEQSDLPLASSTPKVSTTPMIFTTSESRNSIEVKDMPFSNEAEAKNSEVICGKSPKESSKPEKEKQVIQNQNEASEMMNSESTNMVNKKKEDNMKQPQNLKNYQQIIREIERGTLKKM